MLGILIKPSFCILFNISSKAAKKSYSWWGSGSTELLALSLWLTIGMSSAIETAFCRNKGPVKILENEINVKEGDVIGFFASGTTPAINTLEGWAKTYYQPGDISKLSLQKMKKNPATEKYAITVKVQHAKFKKFI